MVLKFWENIWTNSTGKPFSEALVFASTNPQYDNKLFIELQVQYMKIPSSNLGRACCVQKLFLTFRTIFVHNMFYPCSAKARAFDKDLPVSMTIICTRKSIIDARNELVGGSSKISWCDMIEEAVIELCRTLSSWLDLGWWYDEKALKYLAIDSSKLIEPKNRVRPRFFDQDGHQTTDASIGNKYFFTK